VRQDAPPTPARSATWYRHDVPAATSTDPGAMACAPARARAGDGARHVVVIARVAERSGHAAAAGIEIDDLRRRIRDSSAFAGPPGPSIVDGNADAAAPRAVPAFNASVAPLATSVSRNSSNRPRARPRGRAAGLAAQQIGSVLADRDRQLGSTKTIAWPWCAAS
jgi:hypothetical protein